MQFTQTIPADYDTFLGPVLFDHYAEDLAARLSVSPGGAVLETACGTGICTDSMRRRLGGEVPIVATDLSEEMLGVARARRGHLRGVRFEQADASALEFRDGSFDAVVSQFGLMFLPDKLAALREARRVLRPGGRLLFSVWDEPAANPFIPLAQDVIGTFFDAAPPVFLDVPWGFHDRGVLRDLVEQAGFEDVELHTLPAVKERSAPRELANGLVRGTPTLHEVEQRARATTAEVVATVSDAFEEAFGAGPTRLPMQAVVVTATRRAA